jgi:hypothetical protein
LKWKKTAKRRYLLGLDELYNLDSVFEIVRQMKYCRAVPEVVKSKENLTYLKDFISSEIP